MGYLLDIRARRIGFESYEHYLAGDHWKQRRKLFQTRFPKKCYVCRATANVHLHHTRYSSLGDQPDGDLAWLCGTHHEELHRLVRRRELKLDEAHVELRRIEARARRRKKRVQKGHKQGTYKKPFKLRRYDRMLIECVEALEFHGLEFAEIHITSKRQLNQSIHFLHSVLVHGNIQWENDRLRVDATWKREQIRIYLDVDRINDATYWAERRESANKLAAARAKVRSKLLRERAIAEAKREERRLS